MPWAFLKYKIFTLPAGQMRVGQAPQIYTHEHCILIHQNFNLKKTDLQQHYATIYLENAVIKKCLRNSFIPGYMVNILWIFIYIIISNQLILLPQTQS